jgi:hypothetical protein
LVPLSGWWLLQRITLELLSIQLVERQTLAVLGSEGLYVPLLSHERMHSEPASTRVADSSRESHVDYVALEEDISRETSHVPSSTVEHWVALHVFDRSQTVGDRLGRNEKTKVINSMA